MFFGREDILQKLDALLGKHVASLVTCRGRRRIGKSTLIEQFARNNDARFIKIEGVRPTERTSNETELRSFAEQLALQTNAESSLPDNWLSAFKRLDHEIKDDALTVVLLDEISWMGRYDDLFADSIKIAWDNMWKKHDRLVLCRLLLRQTGISRQSCHSVDCSSPDFCPQTFSTAKAVANQIPYADVNNRQKILV